MRTFPDRIRHAISFELIALGIVVPLGSVIFQLPLPALGVVGVVGASLATLWNLLFNLLFDRAMQRFRGSTDKTIPLRILHATLFEVGLLAVLLPFIAWYLAVTLWQAFVLDLSFVLFYLVYGFVFNWAYDRIFPLPEWKTAD